RAAKARPCHPDDAQTHTGDPGRRLALLGDQGPDRRPRAHPRPRAVHGQGRDRPLQDLARRNRGRGCAQADAGVSGLAVLSGERRPAGHRRERARPRRHAGRDAARAGLARAALTWRAAARRLARAALRLAAMRPGVGATVDADAHGPSATAVSGGLGTIAWTT